MSPPEASQPPAAFARPEGLKQRKDFLRAARGRREVSRGFVLQGIDRRDETPALRIGFTCSKKVGNAVARNRAKRRLREAARAVLPDHGRPGWDYVLIGRKDATAALPFEDLVSDLRTALRRLHQRAP
ncbi:ribonuclease P protein component [Ovoidimarina sediminis]|uniref:ribonuclease P protein component n=1 Tax=Ovoidimarina sediminis TaxID=3079856 RepID=UPI002914B0CE|nr:ribonuclease P protein component [Rhodophyticola sp. MJ-SS7]MDU8946324.1 ribonuclease P protein component [Rhodophyticola sp. MJ-SS7]